MIMMTLVRSDDVLTQAEGKLQTMLETLNKWMKKWQMAINPKKSNIMHFRPPRRQRSARQFKVGDIELDYVKSYRYLGTYFCEFLKFEKNAEELGKASGRALGVLIHKYKSGGYMGHSTYRKLFDSCVAPVMDYGSAVWGIKSFKQINDIQLRALRVFLGVHKFCPIVGIEGDTAWDPPHIRHKLNMLKLWNRLVQMDNDRLTKKVFLYDYQNARQGVKNWCYELQSLLESILKPECFRERSICDILSAKEILLEHQKRKWKLQFDGQRKLRFLKSFKDEICTENYVKYNLSSSERSYMAQLRFGILPINIETGRFVNQPIERRICNLCENGIEDENHLLFNCIFYEEHRTKFVNDILATLPIFNQLDRKEKLKIMFEKFHRKTAKFIRTCFSFRQNYLFNR